MPDIIFWFKITTESVDDSQIIILFLVSYKHIIPIQLFQPNRKYAIFLFQADEWLASAEGKKFEKLVHFRFFNNVGFRELSSVFLYIQVTKSQTDWCDGHRTRLRITNISLSWCLIAAGLNPEQLKFYDESATNRLHRIQAHAMHRSTQS